MRRGPSKRSSRCRRREPRAARKRRIRSGRRLLRKRRFPLKFCLFPMAREPWIRNLFLVRTLSGILRVSSRRAFGTTAPRAGPLGGWTRPRIKISPSRRWARSFMRLPGAGIPLKSEITVRQWPMTTPWGAICQRRKNIIKRRSGTKSLCARIPAGTPKAAGTRTIFMNGWILKPVSTLRSISGCIRRISRSCRRTWCFIL